MNNKGYKILSGIKHTMSNRAPTEKKFNELLDEYQCNWGLGRHDRGWT